MRLFTAVYHEPGIFDYPLGRKLKRDFADLPWHEIKSHNRIEEMTQRPNSDFPKMKRFLIIGTRKTHRYTENHKISDYLVPFTSSGCTAMCLYCYLVCNYNKCAYLRLFVNREDMMERLIKNSKKGAVPQTFEIGSNSDLVLENMITNNLEWVIPAFAREGRGQITFPTKFASVKPLLGLDHQGKSIFRMSVNPQEIIDHIELGTSPLHQRIQAVNDMCEAGYPVGILIAPIILNDGWKEKYMNLIDQLADCLTEKAKKSMTIEMIFMTYSFVQNAINKEAFPEAPDLYDNQSMSGGGRGKYRYRKELRLEAEPVLTDYVRLRLPEARLVYVC